MSKTSLKVLVCGATGNQGYAVSETLLGRGHTVLALTRRPDSPAALALQDRGAVLIHGDMAEADSLHEAMREVDAMFLMATPYEAGIDAEVDQATKTIDAASRTGIKHIVYSSGASVDRNTGIPHFDSKMRIEHHLRSTPLHWTIIGPVFFKENFLSPLWLPELRNGRLALALPADRRIQMISMTEIAAFVAKALENTEVYSNKRLDIASDEIAGGDVAAVLASLSGRPIDYEQQSPADMRELGEDFALMFDWFDRIGYGVDIEGLRRDHPDVILSSFCGWAERIDWTTLLCAR